MTPKCFWSQFDSSPCGWPWDSCHLISKQRLRNAGVKGGDLWDQRIVVLGCRPHHHKADNGFIKLGYPDYPASVREYADEHGFYWQGKRDGWLAKADA